MALTENWTAEAEGKREGFRSFWALLLFEMQRRPRPGVCCHVLLSGPGTPGLPFRCIEACMNLAAGRVL